MSKLVANVLSTVNHLDDLVLLNASLASVAPVVDKIIVLDTTADSSFAVQAKNVYDRYGCIVGRDEDIVSRLGFASARNWLLSHTDVNDYVLWLDNDEVWFTELLVQLKDLITQPNGPQAICTHFVHFCIRSNLYERFERRINIFKNVPGIHWEGMVHEHVVFPEMSIFHSDVFYHHYGYVRPQEYVFSRWQQYAKFDGSPDPATEYPDPTKLLEHRRDSLLPYFGEYPKSMPANWLMQKASL